MKVSTSSKKYNIIDVQLFVLKCLTFTIDIIILKHLFLPPVQYSLSFFVATSSFFTYLMQKMQFFTTDFLIFCNWELGCNQNPLNLYRNNYTVLSILSCPEMIGLTVLIRSKNTDFPPYFVLYTAIGITGKSATTTTGDLFYYCCGYLPFYFTIFHPLETKSRD